ncbi:MAG: MBOAT family protein [Candidatus Hydrogenedentes bacterium]|nr:MBOAT family protein [Candidatus Hydrogenedentota bacterium]
MLFNSMPFCLYFPAVAGVYFLAPERWRWAWLLAASYGFYMAWEPGYVALLWISTAVDYVAARRIAASSGGARRVWLGASLTANLGLLFFFKYYNFFRDSLGAGARSAGLSLELPYSDFLLPLGISFYTFQTLSYTIDVYRGERAPERHLGYFALYVCFFPQLVAGPIERASRLLPQLRRAHAFDYDRVCDGLRLMAWGFFKKMVIADRLAVAVERVYAEPGGHSGPVLLLATLAFGYQIYCDFSGYSDIAIGAARVMGVGLSPNFNRPYAASSIRDFWRRWHMTLSAWFRDYVYVPLGGNRNSAAGWAAAILVVFAASGLWHGANWTFLVWGLIHGGLLIAERGAVAVAPGLARIPHALKVALTFSAVHVGWIFFRAADLGEALEVVSGLLGGWGEVAEATFWGAAVRALGLGWGEVVLVCVAVAVVEAVQYAGSRAALQPWFRAQPVALRWAAYTAIFWTIFLAGVFRQTEFYYFVF